MSRRVTIFALASMLLVSCAASSGPVVIPSEELPFRVQRSPSIEPTGEAQNRVTLGLARLGRVFPVQRRVPSAATTAEAVMRALLDGPTTRERARRITTAIPTGTRLLDVTVRDRLADVNLSREFQAPAAHDEIVLRVAQVVFTLIALPHVSQATFRIDGEPVDVVTASGTTVHRPVTWEDYASIGPRPGS
ncbi:MAG TPA: GerMN domain-containing protein [Actinomycetota bacterium]|nr:GerMN domain-containing protein [Actinomycetota bacterium]